MPDYAPGTPMWVDVASPDVDKSRAFYTALFGWTDQVIPEGGGYTMFYLDGKMTGAASPMFAEGQHPAWSTYVCTADADATVEATKDAGGEVLAGPMDVMGQGRMAVLRDPTGAYISIWQPQIHRGAEVVNDPGAFSWCELYTRDIPAAREFYRKVFNWETEDSEFGGGQYTLFKVDGKAIAGGLDMTKMLPESIPPHWLVYFTVVNAAETVEKAKELGASINAGPMDTPMGPIAVISDPVGAVFAVIQFAAQS